jgi:xylulose-5-phosphate/fructose-6-phosphate phosphoketolase
MLRDIMKLNAGNRNFRYSARMKLPPTDWTPSSKSPIANPLRAVIPNDDHVAPDGRVLEVLSEHMCQGWLEGYLLTGRHGFFSCYEAFIHIVDSMFNQHAKWLKESKEVPWRRPIASLNYLLTSHVWRQDHNGFSHQDPGFIDVVVNKKADIVRVYLPPDANCLLSVADHCLRSRNYVNVIVAGKQPALQYLDMDAAVRHCTTGIGIWEWASSDHGCEPDVVMACAGDIPTLETLAAVDLLRRHVPDLKIRVINVVDLMTLQPQSEHPHGLSDRDFDALFTVDKPIVFAFHGYPWLIHRLTYRRTNHDNMHVRGYKEEGTTTTPFDMTVMNDIDRFHLAGDVLDRVPRNSPLRISRDQSSILRTPCRAVASQEPKVAQAGDLPPGQWLLSGGNSRGSKRRYDHGFYSAGGSDDGHAFRLGGPRDSHLLDAAETLFGRTA